MANTPTYEITATIDVAPREHAKTHFSKQVSSGRSLRSSLRTLHADGYGTTVQMPSGAVFPGTIIAPDEMMDDTGYAPRPEYEQMVHLVEGTWMLRPEP